MIEFEIRKRDSSDKKYYLSLDVPQLNGYCKLYLSEDNTLTDKLSECLYLESFEETYFKAMSIKKFTDLALNEFFEEAYIEKYNGILPTSDVYEAIVKALTLLKIDEDYFNRINFKFCYSMTLKIMMGLFNAEINKAIEKAKNKEYHKEKPVDEAESPKKSKVMPKKSEVIDGFPYVIFNNKLNEYVRTPHSTTKEVNMAARFASTDKAYDFIHLNMPFNECDFEVFIPNMEPTPQEEDEAKTSYKDISQETVKEIDQPEDVDFIAYIIDGNGEIHQIKVDSNIPKFEWNEVNLNGLVLRKCNTPQKEETESIDWEKRKSQIFKEIDNLTAELKKRYFIENLNKSFQKEEEENDEKGPHEWTELFRALLNGIPRQ